MKLSRRKIQKSDNTEQMLDAFQSRIRELGGTSSVDSSTYLDESGDAFGEPGMQYTEEDLKKYWDENHEFDPVLEGYDSYDAWLSETLQNTNLEKVEGGCHGSTKSSETEVDEDLEEITGEEDLMEELDSEFIDSSDEINASFDTSTIDTDKLYEVIDKYNTSSPVSGDWDSETADEQQTIADAFGISLDDAKQVMIEILGFEKDDMFIGASTNIHASYDDDSTEWVKLDTKSIHDNDGFLTDYTLYFNPTTGQYACVYGDNDLYGPDDGWFDAEFDNEDEAYEWFESYQGPGDEDDLY